MSEHQILVRRCQVHETKIKELRVEIERLRAIVNKLGEPYESAYMLRRPFVEVMEQLFPEREALGG